MKSELVTWFIFIIILEAFALYCTRKSSDNETNYKYLVLACLLYASIPLLLFLILKKTHKVASLNCSWNVASSIYGMIIGIFIFSEIYSFKQYLGVIFGILAVILMNIT